MVKKVALLFGILILAAATAVAGDEGVQAALELIPADGDVAIRYDAEGRAALEAAIAALENALGVTASFDAANESSYLALSIPFERKEWVNRLSQAYYTLADVFLHGQDSAPAAFTKGQLWGLKSLRMSPDFATEEARHGFVEAVKQETDVAALYWTYASWARKDEFDVLGAVFRNDPPKLLALIERALELDEAYIAYGAYRSLAGFWGSLPPLPISFGQNLPRALSYICPVLVEPEICSECSSCPVDPHANEYFENRLVFAQYYLMEKGMWQAAHRVLQSILVEPIGEIHPLYNAFCQELARELLVEVEKHL